jgi:hypothetical protein
MLSVEERAHDARPCKDSESPFLIEYGGEERVKVGGAGFMQSRIASGMGVSLQVVLPQDFVLAASTLLFAWLRKGSSASRPPLKIVHTTELEH